MAKAQRKLTSEERKICEELAGAALPALGIKLSSAEKEALVSGGKVSLQKRSAAELGGILIRAEAVRHSAGETAVIRDLLGTPTDPNESATPFLRVMCTKPRGAHKIQACLVVGWPPYIGIDIHGEF
jgi:hypothetical protein